MFSIPGRIAYYQWCGVPLKEAESLALKDAAEWIGRAS